MFALNLGAALMPITCSSSKNPSNGSIERAIGRHLEGAQFLQGNPLQMETMIGAQASTEQMELITSYLKLGRDEGAEYRGLLVVT